MQEGLSNEGYFNTSHFRCQRRSGLAARRGCNAEAAIRLLRTMATLTLEPKDPQRRNNKTQRPNHFAYLPSRSDSSGYSISPDPQAVQQRAKTSEFVGPYPKREDSPCRVPSSFHPIGASDLDHNKRLGMPRALVWLVTSKMSLPLIKP